MKWKNVTRCFAAAQTIGSAYMANWYISAFDDLGLYQYLLDENPLEYKILLTAGLGFSFSGIGFIFVDGLVDVVKGTHHYLVGRIWQKLTKSQERKESIEQEIDRQLNW